MPWKTWREKLENFPYLRGLILSHDHWVQSTHVSALYRSMLHWRKPRKTFFYTVCMNFQKPRSQITSLFVPKGGGRETGLAYSRLPCIHNLSWIPQTYPHPTIWNIASWGKLSRRKFGAWITGHLWIMYAQRKGGEVWDVTPHEKIGIFSRFKYFNKYLLRHSTICKNISCQVMLLEIISFISYISDTFVQINPDCLFLIWGALKKQFHILSHY